MLPGGVLAMLVEISDAALVSDLADSRTIAAKP
jgi:hypothetical protein